MCGKWESSEQEEKEDKKEKSESKKILLFKAQKELKSVSILRAILPQIPASNGQSTPWSQLHLGKAQWVLLEAEVC